MKIVIAPDSFKGSLTAKQAADAIETGIKRVIPEAECVKVPMADGGEGTVQSLVDATGGQFIRAAVKDPFNRVTLARYGILGDHQTAVIEMAAASGLQFTTASTADPRITTTYGTGQLILDALDHGVKRIILGLGGSATNDGGAGMVQALGVHLLDQSGHELSFGGGQLAQLATVDTSHIDSRITHTEMVIASDVTNPLIGPKGASIVFGAQKGANDEMRHQLDHNLTHYAAVLKQQLHVDVAQTPGAGAAGGLGAGLLAFTDANIRPGVQVVVAYTHLKEQAKGAHLVFTGEGSVDSQTQFGKAPIGVAQATKSVVPQAPVIALAGNVGRQINDLYGDSGIDAIFPTVQGVSALSDALQEASFNLSRTAENISRLVVKIQKSC
ncbi:glycerate kinase [Secundilactobacillus folii]|uniref:Glycerate kinase n=1 Tax=Secundilactobacillus folii TaxID=2678357 RepID=A0A7X2XT50_9LACO|nr:glycerate kinase [Secundilactobacillus folii]